MRQRVSILSLWFMPLVHRQTYQPSPPVCMCRPAGVGPRLNSTKSCVSAPLGNPVDAFGSVYGERVVTESRHIWSFAINTNKVGPVAVGVADAAVPLDGSSQGPAAIGWHLGTNKPVRSKNGAKLRKPGSGMNSTRKATKLELEDRQVQVLIIVDMDKHRLSVAINEGNPVDLGVTLPESVRPWVFLDGPGVGSVALSEYFMDQGEPILYAEQDELALAPAPALDLTGSSDVPIYDDTGAGVLPLEGDLGYGVVPIADQKPKTTLDLEENLSDGTSRSSSSLEALMTPVAWTDRAASWLAPLQQVLGLQPSPPLSERLEA